MRNQFFIARGNQVITVFITRTRKLVVVPCGYGRRIVSGGETVVNDTPQQLTLDGRKSGGELHEPLTKTEREVLHLLTREFLTPAAIARRRKVSQAAVSKVVTNLRKKGVLSKANTTPINNNQTSRANRIRLHGERYRVVLLSSSREYEVLRRRSNSVMFKGNRVVLYRDSLMVYSFQSFFGVDPSACEAVAGSYWWRFFTRLESFLKVRLLKEGSANVKQVFFHFAEVGNELAADIRRRVKGTVRVFGSRDGKEWLLFDDSERLDECETTRPPTVVPSARDDMADVIQPFFNDLRDNKGAVLLPSEIAGTLHKLTLLVHEQARVNTEYMLNIRTHVSAIQSLAESAAGLRAEARSLRELRSQEKLTRWNG